MISLTLEMSRLVLEPLAGKHSAPWLAWRDFLPLSNDHDDDVGEAEDDQEKEEDTNDIRKEWFSTYYPSLPSGISTSNSAIYLLSKYCTYCTLWVPPLVRTRRSGKEFQNFDFFFSLSFLVRLQLHCGGDPG